MTPELITYGFMGIIAAGGAVFAAPLVPKLWAKLPSRKPRDNRDELAAALRLIADHVAKLTDKQQAKQGTDAVVDLAPLVLVRAT